MSHAFPFRGLKVVDLGQGIASPYCAMLLALYGAEVIKVEPMEGDWSRGLGDRVAGGGHTAMSLTYNRGKRAIRLDLRREEARAVLRGLALKADVLVEGFRPGVAARLGVGYDSLAAENPGLIYLSVSGFGQSGPYSLRPVTDTAAQAFSGFMDINRGPDGVPHRSGALASDVPTGLYAYAAIATALFARAQTGQGRHIDISLMSGSAALLGHKLPEAEIAGGTPKPLNVPAGSYEAADGWIAIALVREDDWRRMCAALDRPDLPQDPRYASFASRAEHEAALLADLRPHLRTRNRAEWIARLREADVICDAVNSFADWLGDAHVQAVGAAVPAGVAGVHVQRTPGAPAESDAALAPAPLPGQDTRAVLAECGLSPAEIDRLLAAGIAA
jgi:crotonobetainyl-CoA:carnitine CoA-transferase CaiB-like acyl-CoA transferase